MNEAEFMDALTQAHLEHTRERIWEPLRRMQDRHHWPQETLDGIGDALVAAYVLGLEHGVEVQHEKWMMSVYGI